MMKRKPFFIGVSGGSASGKTSVCDIIMKTIGEKNCTLIPIDAFYKSLTLEEMLNISQYNFDHPNALDFETLEQNIRDILSGNSTNIPLYSFAENARIGTVSVEPSPVLIIEGIHAFYQESIRNLMDLKIFINTDDDIRLGRKLIRDIKDRGRTIIGGLVQYNRFVKKGYEKFIRPTMKYADIIIPYGRQNEVATQFVVDNIKLRLKDSGVFTAESLYNGSLNKVEPIQESRLKVCKENMQELKEILIKFYLEESSSMNKIWISYLAQKLLKLAKEELKTGKVVPTFLNEKLETKLSRLSFDDTPIILFQYAIFDEEQAKSLTERVKSLESEGKKVSILSYFSSPTCLKQILSSTKANIYCLLCGETLLAQKDQLLNIKHQYKSPTPEDYFQVTTEIIESQ